MQQDAVCIVPYLAPEALQAQAGLDWTGLTSLHLQRASRLLPLPIKHNLGIVSSGML